MKKTDIFLILIISMAGITTLTVYASSVTFNPPYQLQDTTNGNAVRLNIDSSGHVGIGTTNPTESLEVEGNPANMILKSTGNNSTGLIVDSGSSITQTSQIILRDKGADMWYLRKNSANDFDVINNVGKTVMYLTSSSGNVGIGIIDPAQKLDVNGNIRLTGNIVSPNDICIGVC